MVGCASSGSGDSDRGMQAWVDEQGQVRYREAPDDESDGSDSEGRGEDQGADPDTDKTTGERHPEFNLDQYPAAEDRQREQEKLFYSWRDAEGRTFNTPYLYEEESMGRVMREHEPSKASEARVTTSGGVAAPGFRADSEAANLLGLGADAENRLDAFAENCCQSLPRLDYRRLERETTLSISLDESTTAHRFETGESRFALVRLPEDPEQSLVRIRSFIRENGFFVPNAVFLDGKFRPVRLVTDLVLEHTQETWRHYGYMEARIALRPGSGERWVALFSRPEDIRTSTEVGEEGRRARLTHEPRGSLALRLVE